MITETNECCDCAVPAYPCRGEMCELRHVKHYICDRCKEEVGYDELYVFDGEELCIDCIKDSLERVIDKED